MDWRKILEAIKNFFIWLGQIIVYYAPIIGAKIWTGLKIIFKYIRIGAIKAYKWTKNYIRVLIKKTKKKDYSMLICTCIVLVAVIVVFSLIGHNIKKAKENKKNQTTQITTTEEIATADDATQIQNQLIQEATTIYQNNTALLILVNNDRPLDENYSFEHYTLNCGKEIDARSLDDLRNMLNACNEAGHEYNIVNGYVDRQTQQGLVDQGITTQQAGRCENETGLGIDLTDVSISTLDQSLAENETNKWFMENCYTYGYILRYPADKVAVTGVEYQPYHFRYVGKEAAAFLHNNNLTLEEFYSLIGL